MFKNTLIALFLVAVLAVAVSATDKYIQSGDSYVVTFATTSPSADGQPIVKGVASSSGVLAGVAMNGTGTAAEKVVLRRTGVFTLPVVPTATMTYGMTVFASVNGDVEVCTTTLSDTNSGVPFGILLEAIASGTGWTATNNVDVLVCPALAYQP